MSFKQWPMDFWRVNSYSYPSFFSDNDKAKEAWCTFLSFFDFEKYDKLKAYWNSNKSPRKLNPSALESWKATFEECGLLYVITRSNTISITPVGYKLRELAESDDINGFVWTGVNALIHYPLQGPRRARSELHGKSDLFLYRFIYSAIIELDNYLWWSELERILCRVFSTETAIDAINDIKNLREEPEKINHIPLPAKQRKGAFYNSLNQLCNHASMNHLIMETVREETPYKAFSEGESDRKIIIRPQWLPLIKRALMNGIKNFNDDENIIKSLPTYEKFDTEEEYFTFLGSLETKHIEQDNSFVHDFSEIYGLNVSVTERETLVSARVGQGKFRQNVIRVWQNGERCAVNLVNIKEVLIASHIVPWSKCKDNKERLDGANGILLCSHIDKLFDSHLITFINEFDRYIMKISPNIDMKMIQRLGIDPDSELNTQNMSIENKARFEIYLKSHNAEFNRKLTNIVS
ncbi:HNH endonuclease signature motif containing protein [Shewanella algae]|uniref:HNH endonuclease n=1 Tax=Shewanella algae TaxID=38313 RepID=UPI0031F4BDD1